MSLLVWVWGVVWAGSGLPVASVGYTVDVDGPLAEITVEQEFRQRQPQGHRRTVRLSPARVRRGRRDAGSRWTARSSSARSWRSSRPRPATTRPLSDGYLAAMTTQSRPNVFEQQVGNIPPGGTVRVWLRVVQPVPHVDGAYELVLPLTVAPRFVRRKGGPGSDTDAVPGPMVAAAGVDPHRGHRRADPQRRALQRDLVRRATRWGSAWDSPIACRRSPPRWISTRTSSCAGGCPRIGPRPGSWSKDGHVMVTLDPPEAPPRDHIVPRELIWVIDQSWLDGRPAHPDGPRRDAPGGGPRRRAGQPADPSGSATRSSGTRRACPPPPRPSKLHASRSVTCRRRGGPTSSTGSSRRCRPPSIPCGSAMSCSSRTA